MIPTHRYVFMSQFPELPELSPQVLEWEREWYWRALGTWVDRQPPERGTYVEIMQVSLSNTCQSHPGDPLICVTHDCAAEAPCERDGCPHCLPKKGLVMQLLSPESIRTCPSADFIKILELYTRYLQALVPPVERGAYEGDMR